MGQGEDQVKVATGKYFSLAIVKPLFFNQGLTLGAMPVFARVIGDVLVVAFGARGHMPAECLGSAGFYRRHHLELA